MYVSNYSILFHNLATISIPVPSLILSSSVYLSFFLPLCPVESSLLNMYPNHRSFRFLTICPQNGYPVKKGKLSLSYQPLHSVVFVLNIQIPKTSHANILVTPSIIIFSCGLIASQNPFIVNKILVFPA